MPGISWFRRIPALGHEEIELTQEAAQLINPRGAFLPRLSTPRGLKVCFANSIPIVVTFMITSPVLLIEMNRLQSGTFDASGAGGVHIIR